jgi:hypothetical protein
MVASGRAKALCCACAALVTTTGCATMFQMRPAADSYTYDIGLATPVDIRARASNILERLGYKLVRDDGPERFYVESEWRSRPPMDDRERSGGSEIITRVILEGAPRVVSGSPAVYHVLLIVENRFVPLRGTKHEAREPTSSASYAEAIVKEISVAFGGTARPVADEPRPF